MAVEPSLTQLYEQAVGLHRAGRLTEAEAGYCAVLARQPDHFDALHQLGVLELQRGHNKAALDWLDQAMKYKPNSIAALNNRANALSGLNRLDEALADYNRALAINPTHIGILNNRGNLLQLMQRRQEALADYARVIELDPSQVQAWYFRGNLLQIQQRTVEALNCFDRVLELRPDLAEAHNNRGVVLLTLNRPREAQAAFERALALKHDYAEAHYNLGTALLRQKQIDAAQRSFRSALALNPAHAECYFNLGISLVKQSNFQAAFDNYQQALALKPDLAEAYSGRLFAQLYLPALSAAEHYAEHRGYAERYEHPLMAQWRAHPNNRDPARRLRLGYVSADFYRHSVAFFIEPVLAHHDKREVEVYAYFNGHTHDPVTERIKGLVDHWVPCQAISDEALADRIRADAIDILVDLSGHTGGNRLRVFARKPAPVQVTYLGYPATTGLSAMNYRFTTWDVDPAGQEAYHSETLYRLPRSLWCYRPGAGMPEVNPQTPAQRHGSVTFGSMNNIAKVSPGTVALWGEVLRAIPGSRLVMTKVPEGSVRDSLRARFAAVGVEAERLVLHELMTNARYWQALGEIDIGLDPFPYTGTTTTCETLWMGVPVVTLAGDNSLARSGVALLTTVGLPELVAQDETDYVRIAVELARDLPRLSALRAGLRARMKASALRDETGFTREIEASYREMWRRWCQT